MKNIPLYEVRQVNTLKQLLSTSTELYSDRTAFWVKRKGNDKYQPITYKEFNADVTALGTAFLELGLKGKRIAVIGENRYEWIIAYMAAVCGVGMVIPLDKELPENEIESLLVRSQANAVVYSGSCRNSILSISSRIDFIDSYIDMDAGAASAENTAIIPLSGLIEKGRAALDRAI